MAKASGPGFDSPAATKFFLPDPLSEKVFMKGQSLIIVFLRGDIKFYGCTFQTICVTTTALPLIVLPYSVIHCLLGYYMVYVCLFRELMLVSL